MSITEFAAGFRKYPLPLICAILVVCVGALYAHNRTLSSDLVVCQTDCSVRIDTLQSRHNSEVAGLQEQIRNILTEQIKNREQQLERQQKIEDRVRSIQRKR